MLVRLLSDIFAGKHRDLATATQAPVPGSESKPEPEFPPLAPRTVTPPRYRRGGSIIVVTGESEGNALKDVSPDCVRALRSQASAVHTIDCREPDWVSQLIAAMQDPVWFVFGFFGAGQSLQLSSKKTDGNLWTATRIPFVRAYGDIPAYSPHLHRQGDPNSINLYAHPEHAKFSQTWLKPVGVTAVTQPLLLDVLPEEDIDFPVKEKGNIIFPKNCNDPDAVVRFWRNELPPQVSAALETLGEELTSCGKIDQPVALDEEIIAHFTALGIDLGSSNHLVLFLVAQLDDYLRRVKSTMIARALLDYPVEIRGSNWRHVDFTGKTARLIPDTSYVKTSEIMRTALAVIDMSPNTQFRPHDRIMRAAGRYTTFLTNTQKFFELHFDNHAEFSFRFSPESIRERVEFALENPARTVELGRMLGRQMRPLADEAHYACTLATALDTCAFACGERPTGTQPFVAFKSALE